MSEEYFSVQVAIEQLDKEIEEVNREIDDLTAAVDSLDKGRYSLIIQLERKKEILEGLESKKEAIINSGGSYSNKNLNNDDDKNFVSRKDSKIIGLAEDIESKKEALSAINQESKNFFVRRKYEKLQETIKRLEKKNIPKFLLL